MDLCYLDYYHLMIGSLKILVHYFIQFSEVIHPELEVVEEVVLVLVMEADLKESLFVVPAISILQLLVLVIWL